eukprot:1261613-Pleurochrysis_carterae.AAC.1
MSGAMRSPRLEITAPEGFDALIPVVFASNPTNVGASGRRPGAAEAPGVRGRRHAATSGTVGDVVGADKCCNKGRVRGYSCRRTRKIRARQRWCCSKRKKTSFGAWRGSARWLNLRDASSMVGTTVLSMDEQ